MGLKLVCWNAEKVGFECQDTCSGPSIATEETRGGSVAPRWVPFRADAPAPVKMPGIILIILGRE